MVITIKQLTDAGFTVTCVSTDGGHDLDLVWLATKGEDQFLIKSWFGDKSYRYVDSVNELLSGEHELDLCTIVYLRQPHSLLDFEVYERFKDDGTSSAFTSDSAEARLLNLMK